MRRPSPWLLIPLVGACGVGFAFADRPQWKTLTEAEYRAILDPALAEMDPIDKAAQARFERLAQVMERMRFIRGKLPPLAHEVRGRIRRKTPEVAELQILVAQGPFQRGPMKYYPGGGDVATVSEAFSMAALLEARAGHPDLATDLFLTSFRINDRLGECAWGSHEIGNMGEADRTLGRHLGLALPRLRERDLARLAAARPLTPREDRLMRRAIRRDLQYEVLPMLADPLAWARKQYPLEDPEDAVQHQLSGVTPGLPLSEAHDREETYDAGQTVRNANRIFVPLLDNALRGPEAQDLSGEAFGRSLLRNFPAFPGYGANAAAQHLYHAERRSMPNAFGDHLLLKWTDLMRPTSLGNTTYQRISVREAIRTRVALRRYRIKFGRSAPSLASLVYARLLPTLPLDGFGTGTLRYDAAKSRLWSVGRNRKDDRGSAKRLEDPAQPDLVWSTP